MRMGCRSVSRRWRSRRTTVCYFSSPALVLTSYFGILIYLITQGRGMAERSAQQAQQAREELRRVVGFSVADEITELDQLKKSRSITDVEYGRLRAKLVG